MKAKLIDLLERTLWTAIEAGAGAATDVGTSGQVSWRAIGYAAFYAALKVISAQNYSSNGLGDAFPAKKQN